MDDVARKELIDYYKWYWFNELTMGLSLIEVHVELLVCEENEDYEECEGIKQAKKEYINLIKELDAES